jgi:hypothetical protein
MAQMVEPSKCETLTSTPNPAPSRKLRVIQFISKITSGLI